MIKLKRILRNGLLVIAILPFIILPCLSAQDTTQLEKTVAAQELLLQSKDVEIAKLNYQLQSKDVEINTRDMIIKDKQDQLFWNRIETTSAFVAIILWVVVHGG